MEPQTATLIIGAAGLATTAATSALTLWFTGRQTKTRADTDAALERARWQQSIVERWTAERKAAFTRFLHEMDDLRRSAFSARLNVQTGGDHHPSDLEPKIENCHNAYLDLGLLASEDLKRATTDLWAMIFGDGNVDGAIIVVTDPDWDNTHDRFREQYGVVLTTCQKDLGVPA